MIKYVITHMGKGYNEEFIGFEELRVSVDEAMKFISEEEACSFIEHNLDSKNDYIPVSHDFMYEEKK